MNHPIVIRDAASSDFFEALSRDVFLLTRDRETGRVLDVQETPHMDPDRIEQFAASGYATVVSSSIIHIRGAGGVPSRDFVGIVRLDEGPWWWTRFGEVDSLLPEGARMRVAFDKSSVDRGGEVIPFFVPRIP
ncbi:OB-fold domain-containing protein [Salinibacterium sp. SWN139]|uniref:Zn-ribbon domain-containing OB-fold protein n=1 Tax=unclassified Salinibacterium TaxID=2632331 RepID=UPI0018CF5AD4|nr:MULTISPECIES: OB-fold domain-containing protein [unclassified Salinibacterium]MBH0023017.1 OB-fold domain-containing protein [Salinibacterium sp. SWN248]MBH0053039.1 OB-fold domain-containing protein [Salinibacterium sp. SWN139]